MRRARPDSVGKSGGSVPSSKLQVHGATLQHEMCQQASPQKRFHSPALCGWQVRPSAPRARVEQFFKRGKTGVNARLACDANSTHHVLAVATSLAGVCGLYGFRDPLPTPIATNFGYYNTAIELYPTVQGSAAGRAKIHVML
jgi:hypothetical protein